MKKIIIIAAILVAVVVVGSIVAAILLQPEEIRLSGTYSDEVLGTGGTLTFYEDKVIATYRSAGKQVYPMLLGDYEITDGTITMTFEDDRPDNIFAGTFSFELGEGYILFDGVKYYRVDEAD